MKKLFLIILVTGIVISGIAILSDSSIPSEFPSASFEEIKYEQVNIENEDSIKVGVIHSLSGTMAISEKPVLEATLMAIEEINERGGILGKKIIPIVKDGQSDWGIFAESVEQLILEEEVDVIFGGWTSASRKTMLPIFEKYDHLLFYPVQYEGLEQSKNIIYTGAAPNQQVIPAVTWAHENLGTKFFLVGSDYVFPRSANEIIKNHVAELNGEVVGEEYHLLGDTNFIETVERIKETKPNVILNTINGDSNFAFFSQLRDKGIFPENIPTISFSIAENEIRFLDINDMKGDYASWSYFQSLDTPENKIFVKNFKTKFGEDAVVTDPMEAGYSGVYIYAKVVEQAGTTDIHKIQDEIRGITITGPAGVVGVDPGNQHLAKAVRIGKIQSNGQFEIVFSSENPIIPEPYPTQKSIKAWESFLENLYYGWNGNWENPARGENEPEI